MTKHLSRADLRTALADMPALETALGVDEPWRHHGKRHDGPFSKREEGRARRQQRRWRQAERAFFLGSN